MDCGISFVVSFSVKACLNRDQRVAVGVGERIRRGKPTPNIKSMENFSHAAFEPWIFGSALSGGVMFRPLNHRGCPSRVVWGSSRSTTSGDIYSVIAGHDCLKRGQQCHKMMVLRGGMYCHSRVKYQRSGQHG